MTEDGEAPGAGSDGDEEERGAPADRDGAAADRDGAAADRDQSAADGAERGAGEEESTPSVGDEREPAESAGDAWEPESDGEAPVGDGEDREGDVEPGPTEADPAADDSTAPSPWGGEVTSQPDGADRSVDAGRSADDLDAEESGDDESGATEGEPNATRDSPGAGRGSREDVEQGSDEDARSDTAGARESMEADAWEPGDEAGDTDAGATDEAGGADRDERAPGVAGEFQGAGGSGSTAEPDVPEDVRSYDRFQKVDRASYDRVNEFLRDRTYVTAREWAIARLCADFRTATGVEMTKIGENLPHLVPFMTDTYSPQAVNQARSAFEGKVRKSGATFLYGAMSGFFTADELDDIMYEVTEVAKFLLEVEGVELTVDEELDAEDRISAVMREVRQASEELRYDEVACPHCGEAFRPAED